MICYPNIFCLLLTALLFVSLPPPPSRSLRQVEKEGPLKPIEQRALWAPGSTNPQGQIKLWVDIFTADECKKYEPVHVEPPLPLKFEVMVVCWKSANVMAMDAGNMNDL